MIMGGIGLVSRTDIRLEVASYRCRAAGNHSVRLLAVSAIKQLCIVSVDLVWAIRPDCVRCRTLIGRAVIGLESCFSRVLPSALPNVRARLSPGADLRATGSRLMRAGDVPAPVRVASTTFRPAVLGSGAPAWGGVSGLGSHGCRFAFCLPTHRGVQFRCAPLTAGHGCAGNRRTGLVASSSTAFRSTRTLSATGWARCAGRDSGSHCARPLRVAPGRRARACRRPWNRCAEEILLR